MTDSRLAPARHRVSSLATGYEMGARGPRAVAVREMVTAGAASVCSTPRDMARYVAALLGGGANEHGSILRPETVAHMFEPQYQPDPRIPGIGLAFFRADLGGHPAVEHQGTLPGFHSQVFLAPEDGVGVIAFTNGSWRPDFWLPAEISGLLRRLIGVPDEVIRTDVPERPETWGDLCGWYRLPGPVTDVRMRAALGAGAEVFVRGGRLTVRVLTPVPILYRGFRLHPDDPADPTAFRIDLSEFGIGSARVVFGQERGTGTTSVHLDVMPVSLRKEPAATNPRVWATRAIGALAMTGAAIAVRRCRAGTRSR
jgi:hypothetical protein